MPWTSLDAASQRQKPVFCRVQSAVLFKHDGRSGRPRQPERTSVRPYSGPAKFRGSSPLQSSGAGRSEVHVRQLDPRHRHDACSLQGQRRRGEADHALAGRRIPKSSCRMSRSIAATRRCMKGCGKDRVHGLARSVRPSRRWMLQPLERAAFQNANERKQNPVEPDAADVDYKAGFLRQAEAVLGAARGEKTRAVGIAESLRDNAAHQPHLRRLSRRHGLPSSSNRFRRRARTPSPRRIRQALRNRHGSGRTYIGRRYGSSRHRAVHARPACLPMARR